MNRYSRQEAIGGWDQSRLADARIVVAGSGAAALLTALAAVAMGFGSVEILKLRGRTRENGMFNRLVSGTGRAWVDFLRQVNPTIRIAEVSPGNASSLRRTFSRASCVALVGSTAIENRFHSLLERCAGVPIIRGWLGSSSMCWGPVTASAVKASDRGDGVSDLLLAGFVVEELRQTVLPLPGDPDDLDLVKRSTLARAPFVRSPPLCSRLSMVGAGALGTWVSLGLGLANAAIELHIFDADHVEENNLNRQVLYFGAVGKPKSLTLARRIARLFPSVKASGYALFLEERTMNWLPPSGQLVACPDNYAVRDVLNDCAVAAGHSLVSGGTGARGGSCTTYLPGGSPCLDCQIGIKQLAHREAAGNSCMRLDPSVVTSNVIVGGLMAWQIVELMNGKLQPGVWEYDGRASGSRFGVHSQRPACECHVRSPGTAV